MIIAIGQVTKDELSSLVIVVHVNAHTWYLNMYI